jgi:XXXCH domain-containing protein
MEDKNPSDALRRELARHLEALAERLRQGEAPDNLVLYPGIEASIHVKEKRGRTAVKVSLKWLPTPYATPEMVPCKDEGLKQLGHFQDIKKRLGAVFGELQKIAGRGELPLEDKLKEFLDTAREFSRCAEPEWQAEMKIFLDHAANLESALKNRQLEMFRHELRDLQSQMISCHREHK